MKIKVYPLLKKAEIVPNIVKRKKEIVLKVGKGYAKRMAQIFIENEPIFSGNVSVQGDIKLRRQSKEAKKIIEAIASDKRIFVKII